jgi:hypothetical protein
VTTYYCDIRDGMIVGFFTCEQPDIDLVPLEENDPRFLAYKNPPPDAQDVGRERDRRFGSPRGVHHFATSEDDMKRWMMEVTPIAQTFLNLGQPGAEIGISTATGNTVVTALEWQMVLIAAGTHRQPLYQASFALQAMDPIPADYATNPAYWPS